MSAGSDPARPVAPTGAPGRWMAGLRTPGIARFPYRRRIRIASPDAERVAGEIEATLRHIRFHVDVRTGAERGSPGVTTTLIAERNVVRVPISIARALPLVALVGGGVVLGLVDWLVTNQFLVLFPWIAAFAIAAFVFRLRIGGAYLSELIVVEVVPLASSSGGGAPSVGTIWGAGRARSEGEMGPEHERTVVRITPLIPLADNIAFVVQETSRRLAAPAPGAAQSM